MFPFKKIFLLAAVMLSVQGCYTFNNASVDYTKLKTFTVTQFEVKAPNAPATMGQEFSEQLRDKVRNNTRLSYLPSANADVEFSGTVTTFAITAVAPKPGEITSLQQLQIGVYVEFKNKKEEGKDWSNTFSYPATYETGQDFAAVQEQLTQEAFENIIENVFNKSFADW